MDVNNAYKVPHVIVYIAAAEEPALRLTDEIVKIISEGRAGVPRDGFIVVPMPYENLAKLYMGSGQDITDCNVLVSVGVRGSKSKARWVAEKIGQELAPGKIDPYFLQFRAGWSSFAMTDAEAKKRAEEEIRLNGHNRRPVNPS